jgi:hypothetical protein
MQRDRWIDYARAGAVLDRLERLLATPERDRMPCLLLHGESNIGKTQIVRKFVRDHPSSFDEQRGVEKRQIISMQMPLGSGPEALLWRPALSDRSAAQPEVRRVGLGRTGATSLAQRELVQFVLAATGGLTGAVAQLLVRAAELAIRDRSEQITLPRLEEVAHMAA